MKEFGQSMSSDMQSKKSAAEKAKAHGRANAMPNSVLAELLSASSAVPPADPGDDGAKSRSGRLDSIMSARVSRVSARSQAQIPTAEREAELLAERVQGSTPAAVKSSMSSLLGADFSHVRFHTDEASARRADAMGAAAYTAGSDVYFGSYGFEAGLAAHELVHTVQQGASEGSVSVSAPLGGIQMNRFTDWISGIFGHKKKEPPKTTGSSQLINQLDERIASGNLPNSGPETVLTSTGTGSKKPGSTTSVTPPSMGPGISVSTLQGAKGSLKKSPGVPVTSTASSTPPKVGGGGTGMTKTATTTSVPPIVGNGGGVLPTVSSTTGIPVTNTGTVTSIPPVTTVPTTVPPTTGRVMAGSEDRPEFSVRSKYEFSRVGTLDYAIRAEIDTLKELFPELVPVRKAWTTFNDAISNPGAGSDELPRLCAANLDKLASKAKLSPNEERLFTLYQNILSQVTTGTMDRGGQRADATLDKMIGERESEKKLAHSKGVTSADAGIDQTESYMKASKSIIHSGKADPNDPNSPTLSPTLRESFKSAFVFNDTPELELIMYKENKPNGTSSGIRDDGSKRTRLGTGTNFGSFIHESTHAANTSVYGNAMSAGFSEDIDPEEFRAERDRRKKFCAKINKLANSKAVAGGKETGLDSLRSNILDRISYGSMKKSTTDKDRKSDDGFASYIIGGYSEYKSELAAAQSQLGGVLESDPEKVKKRQDFQKKVSGYEQLCVQLEKMFRLALGFENEVGTDNKPVTPDTMTKKQKSKMEKLKKSGEANISLMIEYDAVLPQLLYMLETAPSEAKGNKGIVQITRMVTAELARVQAARGVHELKTQGAETRFDEIGKKNASVLSGKDGETVQDKQGGLLSTYDPLRDGDAVQLKYLSKKVVGDGAIKLRDYKISGTSEAPVYELAAGEVGDDLNKDSAINVFWPLVKDSGGTMVQVMDGSNRCGFMPASRLELPGNVDDKDLISLEYPFVFPVKTNFIPILKTSLSSTSYKYSGILMLDEQAGVLRSKLDYLKTARILTSTDSLSQITGSCDDRWIVPQDTFGPGIATEVTADEKNCKFAANRAAGERSVLQRSAKAAAAEKRMKALSSTVGPVEMPQELTDKVAGAKDDSDDALMTYLDYCLGKYGKAILATDHKDQVRRFDALSENIDKLAAAGLATIYIEELVMERDMPALQAYYRSPSAAITPDLKQTLSAEVCKGLETLVVKAKTKGIAIMPADKTSAKSNTNGGAMAYRIARMNDATKSIIEEDTRNAEKDTDGNLKTGKYILIIGGHHASSHFGMDDTDEDLPGLSAILGVPAMEVKDEPDGNGGRKTKAKLVDPSTRQGR